MIRLFLFLLIFISIIYCFPIITETNDNNLNQIETNDSESERQSLFKSRTLTPYTFTQLLKAKGELKVAFLKFCIFKIKILIKLVSAIYGLQPTQRYPPNRYQYPYDPNRSDIQNADRNRNRPQNYETYDPNDMSVASNQMYPNINRYPYRPHYIRNDYDYNEFEFQLLPEDFTGKGRQLIKSIFQMFYNLWLKIINFSF